MLRWPRSRQHLEAHYDTDSELRSLCAAYEEAHGALDARRRRVAETAAEMSDYDRVIRELETDILGRLKPDTPLNGDPFPGPWSSLLRRVRQVFSA
jgi:hypothetical protein